MSGRRLAWRLMVINYGKDALRLGLKAAIGEFLLNAMPRSAIEVTSKKVIYSKSCDLCWEKTRHP